MLDLVSRWIARSHGVKPEVGVDVRKVRVPMPDGVELRADLYAPRGRERGPIVLLRTPYGRLMGLGIGTPFATRGYFVLVQSCRGTAGSGGRFSPHRDEHDDGLATVAWLEDQPYFDGAIFTFGPSYLGYVQWAIARDAPPSVRAMAMKVTMADFSRNTYLGDSLQLQLPFGWAHLMVSTARPAGLLRYLWSRLTGRPVITPRQWRTLPLDQLDLATVGRRISFWRDWLQHASADDTWWRPTDFHQTIPEVDRPISMLAGWHDIFTPGSLTDFAALQAADKPARLTVGPWTHMAREGDDHAIHDALDWFAEHLGEPHEPRTAPVRLFVMGPDEWRDFDRWPPRDSTPTPFYLHAGGRVSRERPEDGPPDTWIYDPDDPTPSIGGPGLTSPTFSVDNAALEARDDVVCFTSDVLDEALEIIGPVSAQLHVTSTAASADYFVRLCDVDEAGVSRNVSDGLQRVDGSVEPQLVTVEMWPTAYRFARGHRVRVQVSSGAFPRWARNLGTGAPIGTSSELRIAEQAVHHPPAAPSALLLPVYTARTR